MKKWLFLLSFLAFHASADTYFKIGLGTGNSGKDIITETKMASIGTQMRLFMEPFVQQLEAGIWIDSRRDLGRESSGFAGYSVGMHVLSKSGIFMEYLLGPSVITHTDSNLGGNFQFNHDIGVGVKNAKGYSLAFGYKHLSSAGIYMPNNGRDFATFRILLPFNGY
jgi:hypothetical protein